MKKLTFILLFLLVQNTFASPLVFKSTKEINSLNEYVELAVFDAGKYKQVRIAVVTDNVKYSSYIAVLGVEDNESFVLSEQGDRVYTYSQIIELPPSKIQIKVKGKGNYKIFVWAN